MRLLDTDVCVDIRRDYPPAIAWLAALPEAPGISGFAMLELMRGIIPGYVPHGCRSTFRDWAAETTNYPNHVVEMALAHTVGDRVEAAYQAKR